MNCKAIVSQKHGGPEVMKVENIVIPMPQQGQVLISMKAAGVNPVDTYIRAGINNYTCSFPHTPGKDGAGVVEAVGPGVTNVKAGDRVYICGSVTGTYATYAICTNKQVYPLPPWLSFTEGACIGIPYGSAYRALFHCAKATAGETVLIHGASGGVGLAAVQLATNAGLTVFGTASTAKGREVVLANGAKAAFDHSDPNHFQQLLDSTPNKKGFDIIIEMLANVNLGKDLPILALRGRVIVVGNRGICPEINPRDLMIRDASVQGVALFNALPEDLAAIHQALYSNLAVKPVVSEQFKLEEADKSHIAQLQPGIRGKIVLNMES